MIGRPGESVKDDDSIVTDSTMTMNTCLMSIWDHESKLSQHGTNGVGGSIGSRDLRTSPTVVLGTYMRNFRSPHRRILPSTIRTEIYNISVILNRTAESLLNWCQERPSSTTSEIFDSLINSLKVAGELLLSDYVFAVGALGASQVSQSGEYAVVERPEIRYAQADLS